MQRFLVTGAAGFIGRSIAAALLARGDVVRGVDNFITGKRSNLVGLEGMEFIEGDLGDPVICECVCNGVDTIFHEAAIPSVPRSVVDPVSTNVNCVDATLNLLVAARRNHVRRLIYAGSSSAYGDNPVSPKHEGMVPDPISPYAAAKLAGEHYVRAFARVYGMQTAVLRYFNVFGPHQDPTSCYSGVLAVFCSKMLKREHVTIYGDGQQSRDFTYIDNVVHANLLAAAAPADRTSGQVMNVAMGKSTNLNQVFEMLSTMTGHRVKPMYAPARDGDIRHSQADIQLARTLLGYSPVVDLREGLHRTVEWYRSSAVAVSSDLVVPDAAPVAALASPGPSRSVRLDM